MGHAASEFIPVSLAVLTVSDSRGEAEDTSGHYLVEAAAAVGHQVVDKRIIKDNIYQIRAVVSGWIADPSVQAIVITGGTGFTARDNTPEAIQPLFDRQVEGFGELFRMLSYEDIGTSTIQSRALAGIANQTIIFAVPGSTNACKMAWERIIVEQLDARHRPCNFLPHLSKK
ncbi:molybdenum cofactor biosynthesis protein B [Pragia fontium]|uniref:Molybdenum cofactor biosynthesis protein B n=1 Tax=Pragia fontium TaxID=82985 RepID=A0ABQ5LEG2_9GAMM|nr:molybdenum cofactor biosynthesis protein B [Pragia fontium]AKJ41961.1 molybdopterin biosynthesis protein B [Pragia fontium]GKX62015.1 molybdenum cofactor biosynthesis protein B [Pragia fontium]SUB82185.1 Molybdenum cofactor biosynthesis protein B [Pragia fontium]VEJ54894.1 Molybdenum cofactor biosynthesis protein B [Pragia fontium]